jgi:hypothetical protein
MISTGQPIAPAVAGVLSLFISRLKDYFEG